MRLLVVCWTVGGHPLLGHSMWHFFFLFGVEHCDLFHLFFCFFSLIFLGFFLGDFVVLRWLWAFLLADNSRMMRVEDDLILYWGFLCSEVCFKLFFGVFFCSFLGFFWCWKLEKMMQIVDYDHFCWRIIPEWCKLKMIWFFIEVFYVLRFVLSCFGVFFLQFFRVFFGVESSRKWWKLSIMIILVGG